MSLSAFGSSSSSSSATAGINVKDAPYGARGDARSVTDAALNGTTTVTSALAAFTAADVGKVIWGVQSSTGQLRLPETTVVSVTNATTIVVADAATGSYTDIYLVLGTDDTAALQAATTAAKATDIPASLIVPSGGYIFGALPFDGSRVVAGGGINVIGAGSGSTFFFPAPSYDTGSTTSNTGIFFRANAGCRNARLSGVQVAGGSFSYDLSGYHVVSDTGDSTVLQDVKVTQVKGLTAHFHLTGTRFHATKLYSEGAGYIGISCSGGSYSFNDCYTGNHAFAALYVSSVNGSANSGIVFLWNGGIVDESGVTCLIESSTDVKFVGTRMFGGTDNYACKVENASTARFIGCDLVGFGAGENRGGLKVNAGCTAYLTACRLSSNGTGYAALDNAGTVVDGLNNVIENINGTAPVIFMPLDHLPTSDPSVPGQLYQVAGVVMISA